MYHMTSTPPHLSEWEKMKSGEYFNPSDKSFLWPLIRSDILVRAYNRTPLYMTGIRDYMIRKLFGSIDGRPYSIFSPFQCVFGTNIHAGKNLFVNCGCWFQDYTDITIDDDVMIGRNVSLVTIIHPLLKEQRRVQNIPNSIIAGSRGNYERALPVHIKSGAGIYGNSVICPGVTVGENSVIGAGSIVTRDIPPNVFACGVPCRVVREITEADRVEINL